MLRQVAEVVALDVLLLCEHLGAQRLVDDGAEAVVNADLLLQGDDFVPVLVAGQFAAIDERVDGLGGEAAGAVAPHVDPHVEVGDGEVVLHLVLTVYIDDLSDDAQRAAQVFGRLGVALHGDADDHLGAHLTGQVGGIVVLQTAVHQHHVAHPHGRKHGGDGHGGAHTLPQASAVEVHLAVVHDVGGHAGEGDAEVFVEVERVVVAHADALEELGQVLTLDQSAGVLVALAEGEARREDVGVALLAVVEALVAQVLLIGDHVAPVLLHHQRVEGLGVVADGVETADDAAHRGAGDDVHGDAGPLQHFQHADVRHAFGAAAAEHHAHLLASGRLCGRLVCGNILRAVVHGCDAVALCLQAAAAHQRGQTQEYHFQGFHSLHNVYFC